MNFILKIIIALFIFLSLSLSWSQNIHVGTTDNTNSLLEKINKTVKLDHRVSTYNTSTATKLFNEFCSEKHVYISGGLGCGKFAPRDKTARKEYVR